MDGMPFASRSLHAASAKPRVYWTSHTGKPRQGRVVMKLAAAERPTLLVQMEPTGQMVKLSPSRVSYHSEVH